MALAEVLPRELPEPLHAELLQVVHHPSEGRALTGVERSHLMGQPLTRRRRLRSTSLRAPASGRADGCHWRRCTPRRRRTGVRSSTSPASRPRDPGDCRATEHGRAPTLARPPGCSGKLTPPDGAPRPHRREPERLRPEHGVRAPVGGFPDRHRRERRRRPARARAAPAGPGRPPRRAAGSVRLRALRADQEGPLRPEPPGAAARPRTSDRTGWRSTPRGPPPPTATSPSPSRWGSWPR